MAIGFVDFPLFLKYLGNEDFTQPLKNDTQYLVPYTFFCEFRIFLMYKN